MADQRRCLLYCSKKYHILIVIAEYLYEHCQMGTVELASSGTRMNMSIWRKTEFLLKFFLLSQGPIWRQIWQWKHSLSCKWWRSLLKVLTTHWNINEINGSINTEWQKKHNTATKGLMVTRMVLYAVANLRKMLYICR